MKKTVYATIFAALFTVNAQADTVGLYVGGQVWQSEANGTFGEQNTLVDFNLKKQQQFNYFIAVEHPFPFIPNARISNTSLDTTGKTTLTQAYNFGGETFATGDDVNANFNVSYFDYTLYYELFDNNLFSFELGLTVRDFNGDVIVTGAASNSDDTCNDPNPSPDSPCSEEGDPITPTGKINTNGIEPMLYAASDISLPLKGLSIFAQGSFLLTGDHSLYDYQLGISYDLVDSKIGSFDLTLGYQAIKMEFEDFDSLYSDLEFKGAFIGVIAHF